MADGGEANGNWLMGVLLTAIAVAAGVVLAGYIGGYIQSKQPTTATG